MDFDKFLTFLPFYRFLLPNKFLRYLNSWKHTTELFHVCKDHHHWNHTYSSWIVATTSEVVSPLWKSSSEIIFTVMTVCHWKTTGDGLRHPAFTMLDARVANLRVVSRLQLLLAHLPTISPSIQRTTTSQMLPCFCFPWLTKVSPVQSNSPHVIYSHTLSKLSSTATFFVLSR